MTKEEVMKLAREAGIHVYPEFEASFERFAALVAAAERESCAKVCEKAVGTAGANYLIAAAIRNRGKE